MRTLTARLTLGFWLVALAAVGLVGGGTYLAVRSQFQDLVQAQNQDRLQLLQTGLANYYAVRGSWDGVEPLLTLGLRTPLRAGPGAHHGMGPAGAGMMGTGSMGPMGAGSMGGGRLGAWLQGAGGLRPRGPGAGLGLAGAPRLLLLDERGQVVADTGGAVAVPESEIYLPITVGGREVGRLLTGGSAAMGPAESAFLRALALACLGAVLGGGLLAAGLGRWAGGRVAAPLRQVAAAAQRVAGGELAIRVPEPPEAELAQLASAFNEMARELERQQALRRQTLADVTHELRTPVTTVLAHLESAADRPGGAGAETLLTMHDEVLRVARLISDLHELSVAEAGHLRLRREPVAPLELTRRAAEVFAPVAAGAGLDLAVTVPALPAVYVDADRMLQVLHNLLSNALRHTPAGGRVTIDGWQEGATVVIAVADTGAGIDPRDLPNIFERFYRADPSRARTSGGSGLGLAIARAVVEAHGGRIRATSEPGRGTTIQFALPLPGHPGAAPAGGPVNALA